MDYSVVRSGYFVNRTADFAISCTMWAGVGLVTAVDQAGHGALMALSYFLLNHLEIDKVLIKAACLAPNQGLHLGASMACLYIFGRVMNFKWTTKQILTSLVFDILIADLFWRSIESDKLQLLLFPEKASNYWS